MGRLLTFLLITFFLYLPFANGQPDKTKAEVDDVYKDIRETLGLVPSFLKEYPSYGLTGAWKEMKAIEFSAETAIPLKYKELILTAVSSQVPCRLCTYFHQELAKVNNSADIEIREAVAVAGLTRKWSAFLNGVQIDVAEFRSEIDKVLMFQVNQKNIQAMEVIPAPEERKIETVQDVFRDMRIQFGMVPNFMTQVPKASLVGAWKELKGLSFNPYTAIPQKYKELIGVAVSGQIPCPYCVYYHTMAAINAGATKEELEEAATLAGSVRAWSGVLSNLMMSEEEFKIEVERITKFLKNKTVKKVGAIPLNYWPHP